jgi:hypothetical protein
MDDSETQERLLYLGKKLETNLENDNGNETSAWMAHFIAEKMAAIDSARGKAKASAQRECFEVILMLWDQQGCFPHDTRPFKDFDSTFRAMAHIDPNKTAPSFFRNENEDNQPPKEIEQAIKLITNLDAAARIMISFFVRESILHATDESTLEWLDAISGMARSDEARIILKLIPELDDKDTAQAQNEKRKNELSEHIDRLEAFECLSREIKSVLKAELRKFEAEH